MSSSTPIPGNPGAATRAQLKKERQKKALKDQYLTAYNTLSAVLWGVILGRIILLAPMVGLEKVYGGVGNFTKWTQSLAILEIVHAALGLVRTPIMTTIVQVLSRLNLVWPILAATSSMRTSPAYTAMVSAWSITEIIRYSYYALNLHGAPPAWLTTLRYNTFFVLYPVGIVSEAWCIYGSLKEAGEVNVGLGWLEMVVLYGTYVPGAYVMYTHMMSQRRKVMRGKKPMRN